MKSGLRRFKASFRADAQILPLSPRSAISASNVSTTISTARVNLSNIAGISSGPVTVNDGGQLYIAAGLVTQGGRPQPTEEETEAAELVIRHGAGSAISDLAQSTPSGRSLAVPLFVLAGLMDRGLPSDQAIARVHAALAERGAARAASPPHPVLRGEPTTVPSNNGRRNRPHVPGQS